MLVFNTKEYGTIHIYFDCRTVIRVDNNDVSYLFQSGENMWNFDLGEDYLHLSKDGDEFLLERQTVRTEVMGKAREEWINKDWVNSHNADKTRCESK